MATTPGGLPYPLPTEPVADGALAIRQLAEALEPRVFDTGWVAATPGSGFTIQSAAVRRIGRAVYFRGTITGPIATGTVPIGSVPVAFATSNAERAAVVYGTSALLPGWISSTGTISVANNTGSALASGAISLKPLGGYLLDVALELGDDGELEVVWLDGPPVDVELEGEL